MKPSFPLRLLIAGGGTGGHLFPGIAIAEEFQSRYPCNIRFVGTKKGLESKVIPTTQFKLYTIPVSGLYRVGFIKKVATLLKLPFAILKSLWIILSFRPHLIIGIGGYASGPVLALAVLLRKRTVIQEQNAYPGMTNRILGKYVDLAFIPFAHTKHLFKDPIVVGNPIRKAIKDAAPATNNQPASPVVIAIVGGSQGSHIINATLVGILPELSQLSNEIRIIHQSGAQDHHWLRAEYLNYPQLKAEVTIFIDDMVSLYRQSHLFICRAGSMINEIIAMGKASILIPIAVSSGDHQKENAKVMMEVGAAIMLEEKELTPAKLFETLYALVRQPVKLTAMGNNARSLYSGDSAREIVSTIYSFFNLTRSR